MTEFPFRFDAGRIGGNPPGVEGCNATVLFPRISEATAVELVNVELELMLAVAFKEAVRVAFQLDEVAEGVHSLMQRQFTINQGSRPRQYINATHFELLELDHVFCWLDEDGVHCRLEVVVVGGTYSGVQFNFTSCFDFSSFFSVVGEGAGDHIDLIDSIGLHSSASPARCHLMSMTPTS